MALVITIAGVNRTTVTDFDNLTVTQIADSFTFSAEVTINDRDSDITIKAGSHLAADKITLVDGGETFFGGFIDDIDFTCLEDGSRRQHLHCVGFGVLLGECLVEYEEYGDDEGGVTDKFIIEEIFENADYLDGVIDATTALVVELADPLVILFEEMTVDEIMTAICNRTGGRFYVDNDLVLHYFAAETNDCGFDLSDTPNDVTSFSYFDNPEKTRTGGNIVNKARIVGADGYTATRTDGASQAAYGIQGAIVTDATLFATSELNERGDDVLDDQKDPRDKYVVSTTHAGAVAGDLIDFKCDDLGYNSISDGDPQLVVREIHIRWEQGDPVYGMTLGELEYSSISKSKSVATQVKALVLAQGQAGGMGWGHDLEFSATDLNTVAWQSGVIVSDAGKTYNIDAGNTGNMAAVTYVYLHIEAPPAAAPTALSAGTDIGDIFALKKSIILIAACCNVAAGLAEFNVFRGGHATPGGTAIHDHSDGDAGDVNVRPDRIGVDAAVADLDGVIALAETFEFGDPTNVAGVGMLYCKDNEGTYLYFMNDVGGITMLGRGKDDHGDLLGLGDDDHAQYLLTTGARAVTGNLNFSTATAANPGMIEINNTRFFHTYGTNNLFIGLDAGNFTLTATETVVLGANTGQSLTSGPGNVLIGYDAGTLLTTGFYNVAIGWNALETAVDAINNVAIGVGALQVATSAASNIALGTSAGLAMTTGQSNVLLGVSAGRTLTTGGSNFALGTSALRMATTSGANIAIGIEALRETTTGDNNVAIGTEAMRNNLTGLRNVAIGSVAGHSATGSYNTLIGYQAGRYIQIGDGNVAIGYYAGRGTANHTKANNTIIGYQAGHIMLTADNNVLIGYQVGDIITTGDNNIIIGYDIDPTGAGVSSELNIGALIYGALTSGMAGINVTPPSLAAAWHVHQATGDAAIPVLLLDQADVDQDMIEFACTIGVGNAIEAVGGKTLTVTHFIKVTLPGALTRYIPVGTIA